MDRRGIRWGYGAQAIGWMEERHNRGSTYVGGPRLLPRRQCASRGEGMKCCLAAELRVLQRRRSEASRLIQMVGKMTIGIRLPREL